MHQAQPEISVVIGVYNGADRLAPTLESVLRQHGCAIELIVVDDGSTDGTAAMLAQFAQQDARVRVIQQPNRGLTRALITGCDAARAPLIARCDAGDVFLPGRLQRQRDAMQAEPRLAFVSCATEFADPDGRFLYRVNGTARAAQPRGIIDLAMPLLVADGPSHHGAVMFRAEAYRAAGGYRPQFYFGQDWDLWYRLAQHGLFQALPETLYRARLGVGDISSRYRPQQERIAALSRQALRARLAGQAEDELLRQAATIGPQPGRSSATAVASGSYFLGECLRRNGDRAAARAYFLQAIRHRPAHLKAWVRLAQSAWPA